MFDELPKEGKGWIDGIWKDTGDARDFVKNPVPGLLNIRRGLAQEYVLIDQSKDKLADLIRQTKDITKPEDVFNAAVSVFGNGGAGGKMPIVGVSGGSITISPGGNECERPWRKRLR